MSHLNLASQLNELVAVGRALISESASTLIVSRLRLDAMHLVTEAAMQAGWQFLVADSQGTECDPADTDEDYEPFRVDLQKPARASLITGDHIYLATLIGFTAFLKRGHPATHWHLLGLSTPFKTRARTYGGWEDEQAYEDSPASKSPRLLVKESATVRTVPEDVRHWLLAEGQTLQSDDTFHRAWAIEAFDALSRCLANEIDASGNRLTFKGPPKLNLDFTNEAAEVACSPQFSDFEVAQSAAAWVFDNAREAEVKHILLSAEIARSGRADGQVAEYFREYLATALECAKIAYQMAVSEITKDTLKSLGDLRKAVTEETSKATDATRQAVAAIATALTVGVGLIAARLTLQINPFLISVVMAVALCYTAMNVFSGWKFIDIQKRLRREWQSKLYRYLSTDEYKKMVADPIGEAERMFSRASLVGLSILAAVAIGVIAFAFMHDGETATKQLPSVEGQRTPPAVQPALRPRMPESSLPIPRKLIEGSLLKAGLD